MNYIINNHIIDVDIYDVLVKIRELTDGRYCNTIIRRGDNIGITCPFHKDGMEKNPSCYVYNKTDKDDIPLGFFKCFTCAEKGTLDKLVSFCFNWTSEEAKQWLVDNYSHTFTELSLNLPEIELGNEKKEYMDESILNQYRYIHPYIEKRGVSEDIIKRFSIGWNKENNSITFPVWDEHNHLLGITERSVRSKYFYIPDSIKKPVYLLNFIKRYNINEVYIVESQIDALYLWSMGYPAVALLGTGAKSQYEILKKSGIRIYHLAMDGDLAGRHGNIRFIKNMPDDVIIDVVNIPLGKDINDLSKEEIDSLERIDKLDYLKS